jgi:hypothetical protein
MHQNNIYDDFVITHIDNVKNIQDEYINEAKKRYKPKSTYKHREIVNTSDYYKKDLDLEITKLKITHPEFIEKFKRFKKTYNHEKDLPNSLFEDFWKLLSPLHKNKGTAVKESESDKINN